MWKLLETSNEFMKSLTRYCSFYHGMVLLMHPIENQMESELTSGARYSGVPQNVFVLAP